MLENLSSEPCLDNEINACEKYRESAGSGEHRNVFNIRCKSIST